MERNTNTKGGFWMLVEDFAGLIEDANDKTVENKEASDDEFFPDTSF